MKEKFFKNFKLLIIIMIIVFGFRSYIVKANYLDDFEKNYSKIDTYITEEEVYQLNEDARILSENYDLEEELDFEREVGKILGNYVFPNDDFENKAISLDYIDREYIVTQILRVYNEVTQEERDKFDTYVMGTLEGLKDINYTENIKLLELEFEKLQTEERKYSSDLYASSRDSFNVDNAVYYAYRYYNNYNTDYPDISVKWGDCTNFVSQILYYGGYKQDDFWYISRKNYKYNSPKNIDELNYSWRLADPSPWISAKKFDKHWSYIVKNYTVTDNEYIKENMFNKLNYYIGDVVVLLKKGWFGYYGEHAMFITSYVYNDDGIRDFGMTYHTTNRKDRPLRDVVKAFVSDGGSYRVKFFKTKK